MNIFKKKMTLIADVFEKLRTPKNVVRRMCNLSHFRRSFEEEHGKRVHTLFKNKWQHLYHINITLWSQFSFKKSLLEICKMLRLFFNTLTSDEKHSLLNRDNLTKPIPMQLYQKQKTFPQFFSPTLKSSLNFEHCQNQRWPSTLMYFQNYGLRKTWLDQYLKSPVSEDLPKSNMVNGSKHCWNPNDSTFTIFLEHSQDN